MATVDVRRGLGIVDVRRDRVQEWVLPAPLITAGDTQVAVSGGHTDTKVSVLGTAPAAFDCAAPTSVSGLAEAVVEPFGSVFVEPLTLASAVVEFDNTGSSVKDVASVPAVAVVEVTGPGDLAVGIFAVAAVAVDPSGPLVVQVIADAEVEFAYYGNGNYPVFPYTFPALFTDNSVGAQDAAALVELTGVGEIAAISGFAEAVLPTLTGEVALGLRGSTPIFPWFLPIVFDDLPANVSAGPAVLLLNMASPSAVVLAGEATAAINAPGSSLPSAVFPWTFPVILIGAV
jgi:hypothetical protein